MNGFIGWMNSAGESFVLFAIRMLIQSSVLIAVLLLLDLVLRKRVRAVVRCWIWLLVLAKLLLPPSLSSPTSLAWWLGDKLPQAPIALIETAAKQEKGLSPSPSTPQTTPGEITMTPTALDSAASSATAVASHAEEAASPAQAAPASAALAWQALALTAWLIVVAVMLVLLVQRAVFVRGLVLQSQDAPEPLCDLLDRCRRQMHVRPPVRLRLTSLSASPSVCGLVRPTILVPQRMLSQLNGGQLKSILLHELAHIRRADLWVNLVQTLLQIVYVYHPLVWLANTIIRRVREQAVDETVLAAMGDEAEEYPRTLLSVSKLAFDHPALSLRLVGVVESKRTLTARIRHITSRPFPLTAKLGFAGCVLVMAVAITLLPMASAAPEPVKTESVSQTDALPAGDTGTPVGSATLSGRAADPQGKPAEGAEVTLYEALPGELGVLPDVERIDRMTTGADGAFTFAVARNARTYREGYVVVRKEGLSAAWAPWPMHEDHKLNIALGQPVELAGEVVDEAGRPIAGAEVHIAMAKIGKGESLRELRAAGFFQTRTDSAGRFVFADMPAGATFEFLVTGPGRATVGTTDISSFSREQCRFASGQTGIRLTLPEEARIEGVVVEKAGGKPVAGVQLRAHPDRRGSGAPIPSKHVVTARDGTFHIDGLSPGTCVVELWTPRGQIPEWVAADMRTSLRAGETKSDLRMELTQGAFIEAFIRDPAGKPVEKVNAHFELIGQSQGFGERTDANGLARIRVLPGSYRVSQIYRPGYTPPATTNQVTIEEGQTKRMEFTVIPAPKVAGIVRDEAGNPLAGVKVQVVWIKMLSSVMSETTSDASGRFEIEWGGSSMTRSPTAVILVARDSARNLAYAMDIDEHTGPLDIKLKPGAIITGTIVDQDGKPLPGASARVLLRVARATVRLGWRELAIASPDGVFEARGFPPEQEYAVEVSADGYGKQEIPVNLLDAKQARHDIGPAKLARSNLSVSGVVVDPNDEPVAGAEVSPFGAGQPDLRSVQTDAQGRFTIQGVSPGPITLGVNPRGQSRLSGSAQAEGGATDVRITVNERRSAPGSAPPRGASLKGKALPSLKDLGVDLPADMTGKMLLVCFWDMNQRPSRNALTQLADRAKELADKGVVIVAVQSAGMEEAALKEWIGQNKIPFPVGRIRTEESKTRGAWGVRSLPWLILTDRDHIVQAEGFDLSELQGKVEAVGPAKSPAVSSPTGTTISGMVVDAAGKPVSDAYVSVENTDLLVLPEPKKFGSQMRKVMRADDTRTDLQGHFHIKDLNPGRTGISVWASGYRTESVPDVSTGTEGLRIVLREPRPYLLSGVVVDDSGKGIPDAEVTFIEKIFSERESNRSPTTLRTDGTGTFRLGRALLPIDFQAASRELFVRKQGYGIASRATDTTGGETSAQIVLSAEERISGAVRDEAGEPIAGATVMLRSWWGQRNTFCFSPVSQYLSPQALTDANGSFTLSQIPTESDVFLVVQAQGYAPADLRSVRTGRFGSYVLQRNRGWSITGNTGDPNAPLVITLEKAVTLRGTVVYEGTGQPAGAIHVFTQPTERGNGSEAVTDAGGRFEMTDVSPAPCNLMVMMEAPARGIVPEWTAAAVRLSDLESGETRDGLRLVLTKGDLIRGKVTDSQDRPLKGIDIAFYSAARPRSGAACQTILTAPDGTWTYRFPPGEVYIYIRTNIVGASWDRKAYTYDLIAGQTIENADFVLNQAVPEGSPYKSAAPATATETSAPPRR